MSTGDEVWVRLPDDNVIFEEELRIYRQHVKRASTEEVIYACENCESCFVCSLLSLPQIVQKLLDAGLRPSYLPSIFSNFDAIALLQVSNPRHSACFIATICVLVQSRASDFKCPRQDQVLSKRDSHIIRCALHRYIVPHISADTKAQCARSSPSPTRALLTPSSRRQSGVSALTSTKAMALRAICALRLLLPRACSSDVLCLC